MSRFPLCEKAGFTPQPMMCESTLFIDAAEVEAFLGFAPKIYGSGDNQKWETTIVCHGGGNYKYQARLIMIEPLRQESEEIRLLRELVADWNKYADKSFVNKEVEARREIHRRAEKLLQRLDEKSNET